MKNFPVKILEDTIVDGVNMKGKTFWVSRACAVAVFIFTKYHGEWYILANQRGRGCPDFVGYWSCPCGYVDYNETIMEAAKRELWEESGLNMSTYNHYLIHKFKNIGYNDEPDTENQNITFRFSGQLLTIPGNPLPELSSDNSEPNEIAQQGWIPLKDISKYTWAFRHDYLILDIFRELYES